MFLSAQDPDGRVKNGKPLSPLEVLLVLLNTCCLGKPFPQLCSQWEDQEQHDSLEFFVLCAFVFLLGVDIYPKTHFALQVLNPILSSLTSGLRHL